jgi:hypothetical protein
VGHCNLRSKHSDVIAPLPELRGLLIAALDDIGCRDSLCRREDGTFVHFVGGVPQPVP